LKTIRIALFDMSPLLREIVRRTLDREPDLQVVVDRAVVADALAAVERDRADFVIIGSNADQTVDVRSLLACSRGVRVLELRSDGKKGVLHELRPHRVALGELSPDALLRTIRAIRSDDAGGPRQETRKRRTRCHQS
jgi:chemotaxis response regulator CheB